MNKSKNSNTDNAILFGLLVGGVALAAAAVKNPEAVNSYADAASRRNREREERRQTAYNRYVQASQAANSLEQLLKLQGEPRWSDYVACAQKRAREDEIRTLRREADRARSEWLYG